MDVCYVNDEKVQAQQSDFNGVWIISKVLGSFNCGHETFEGKLLSNLSNSKGSIVNSTTAGLPARSLGRLRVAPGHPGGKILVTFLGRIIASVCRRGATLLLKLSTRPRF